MIFVSHIRIFGFNQFCSFPIFERKPRSALNIILFMSLKHVYLIGYSSEDSLRVGAFTVRGDFKKLVTFFVFLF